MANLIQSSTLLFENILEINFTSTDLGTFLLFRYKVSGDFFNSLLGWDCYERFFYLSLWR